MNRASYRQYSVQRPESPVGGTLDPNTAAAVSMTVARSSQQTAVLNPRVGIRRVSVQECSIASEVTTVNYHLWKPCNMTCGFCFATFLDLPTQGAIYLPQDDSTRLITRIAEAGFRKINFAGGEPSLCPWLPKLIRHAKSLGLTTSMVTNGSRIAEAWLDSLAGSLNILAISIDSVDSESQRKIGRLVKGKSPMTEADYLSIGESAKARGIRLEVNTVVNRHNVAEDFRAFIWAIGPERWKIFQVLPVAGQNNLRIDEFAITRDEFDLYVDRNRSVEGDGIRVVPENNEAMTGSYLMIDPMGRLFDNTKGEHTYSSPILTVGVKEALAEIEVFPERFIARGGLYD